MRVSRMHRTGYESLLYAQPWVFEQECNWAQVLTTPTLCVQSHRKAADKISKIKLRKGKTKRFRTIFLTKQVSVKSCLPAFTPEADWHWINWLKSEWISNTDFFFKKEHFKLTYGDSFLFMYISVWVWASLCGSLGKVEGTKSPRAGVAGICVLELNTLGFPAGAASSPKCWVISPAPHTDFKKDGWFNAMLQK